MPMLFLGVDQSRAVCRSYVMLNSPADPRAFLLLQERAEDINKRLEKISAAVAALELRAATLEATLAELQLRFERASERAQRLQDQGFPPFAPAPLRRVSRVRATGSSPPRAVLKRSPS